MTSPGLPRLGRCVLSGSVSERKRKSQFWQDLRDLAMILAAAAIAGLLFWEAMK